MTRVQNRLAMLGALAVFFYSFFAPAMSGQSGQEPPVSEDERAHFKGWVDFVKVKATVTDAGGRFVSGLRMDDFDVYEDDQRVEVANFSFERVPISLGIALDTSDSMDGDKIKAARGALDRLLDEVADRKTG